MRKGEARTVEFLHKTAVHWEESNTSAREGRRQLGRSWREETAYDLRESKKKPPQELDNKSTGRNGA